MELEQQLLVDLRNNVQKLTEVCAATQQSVEDMKKGLPIVLAEIKKNHSNLTDSVAENFKDVGKRIGKVERRQSWIAGVGTAVAFAISSGLVYLRLHF